MAGQQKDVPNPTLLGPGPLLLESPTVGLFLNFGSLGSSCVAVERAPWLSEAQFLLALYYVYETQTSTQQPGIILGTPKRGQVWPHNK